MSIARAVGKGIAWNTFSTFLEKGIILANVFVTLTFLTIHEYGLVQLILSALSIASIALLPGFSDAIVADLAVEYGRGNKGKVKEVLVQYITLLVILSIASWSLLYFGSVLLGYFTGGDLASQYLRLISYVLLLAPARSLVNMLLAVTLKFKEQAFYTAIEEVSKLLLLVVLVVWLRRGVEGVLIATVVSQVCAVVAFLPIVFPMAHAIVKVPGEKIGFFWKTFSAHRLWNIANSYVGTAIANAQIWIIKLFLGTDAVALFSVAQGLAAHVASLLPLSTVIVPVLPRYVDKPKQFRKILKSSIKVQLVSAVGLIAFGAIAGPAIVYLFFAKYSSSLVLYEILLVGIFASSVNVLYSTMFITLKRQKEYFTSSFIKLFLTIIGMGTCVYLFGIWGTAIGSVSVALISAAERQFRLNYIEPEYAMSYSNFFALDLEERVFIRTLNRSVKKKWSHLFSLI